MKIIKYIIRKGTEYLFPYIDEKFLKNSINILSEEERALFMKMENYDIAHSLEVYRKIKETELGGDIVYLKLALLHDCGKGKVPLILRAAHKMGIRTSLREHALKGYEKMKEYDMELAILIKNHHVENYSEKMNVFQACDDEC